MPVQYSKDTKGCFARWGQQGAKYYYKCGSKLSRSRATEKARAQGLAIGEYGHKEQMLKIFNSLFASEKISFDYDGVLTTSDIQQKAKDLLARGIDVYVVSARNDKEKMLELTNKIGILNSNVFATGSNDKKIEKINELNIKTHYDNNPDVIKELGNKGKLV